MGEKDQLVLQIGNFILNQNPQQDPLDYIEEAENDFKIFYDYIKFSLRFQKYNEKIERIKEIQSKLTFGVNFRNSEIEIKLVGHNSPFTASEYLHSEANIIQSKVLKIVKLWVMKISKA